MGLAIRWWWMDARASIIDGLGLHDQILLSGFVNQAIRFIYSPGPETREAVLQCLWLTDASEGISLRRFDQIVDAFEDFPILRSPVDVADPGLIRELHVAHVAFSQYREC